MAIVFLRSSIRYQASNAAFDISLDGFYFADDNDETVLRILAGVDSSLSLVGVSSFLLKVGRAGLTDNLFRVGFVGCINYIYN